MGDESLGVDFERKARYPKSARSVLCGIINSGSEITFWKSAGQ